jgi:hypothetical protein
VREWQQRGGLYAFIEKEDKGQDRVLEKSEEFLQTDLNRYRGRGVFINAASNCRNRFLDRQIRD